MSVDLDKLPRWIDKTTSCLYCSKVADLYDVYLDGEKVQTPHHRKCAIHIDLNHNHHQYNSI
jgi:hypothetical protein